MTRKIYIGYAVLIAVLAIGVGLVYGPSRSGKASAAAITLSDVPTTLGKWKSTDLQISDGVLSTLGARDYLLREYTCGGKTLTVYITYFNTGSGALTHNPEKCYTGSGWTFLDKKTVQVPNTNQIALESTLARGDDRQIVVYWYQDRARVLVSKWRHIWSVLWRTLAGSSMHSLVASVSAPIEGSDPKDLEAELTAFSGLVMGALAERLPS